MFPLCLCVPLIVITDQKHAARLIGESNLAVGVNVHVKGCLPRFEQLCDRLETCPGCALLLAQCQLGLVPAPCGAVQDKQYI